MHQRLVPILTLALVLLFPLFAIPARAAEPGAELFASSGVLSATTPTFSTRIYSSGPANIRLAVSGGTASDTTTLTVRDSSNTPVGTWIARSGETIWGFTNLPIGGSLVLQNNSSATVNFTLAGYARGTVTQVAQDVTAWNGVALGDGGNSTNSAAQLVVPTSGLYRFALGAEQGSFQLVVDDNYIRKTVVSGSAPDPADSVYYLAAGTHTFTVAQDPTAGAVTAWSMQITAVGDEDTLPNSEATAQLGGGIGGGAFTEEWIPVHVPAEQAVNIRVAIVGAPTDSLTVQLRNGATDAFSSQAVSGGEVVWGSSQLTSGPNALRIVSTAGNSAPLAYTISITAIGQPAFEWTGTSFGTSPYNSSIRLSFPSDGLYQFTLGAGSGRYQLRLNDTALRKVVTTGGMDFTAFVPAGTHTLTVDQDSNGDTAWSVAIASTDAASDSLTYTRNGVTIGGSGNDFVDEWLPIQMTSNTPVNIKLAAQGTTAADSLRLELYHEVGGSPVYSVTNIYNGENFWAATDLVSGTNLLRIVANNSNATPMSYQIDVNGVANTPTAWGGTSLSNGPNSTVRINAPEAGVYNIDLTVIEGAGQVLISSPTATTMRRAAPANNTLTLRVPLEAGQHFVTFQQDPSQPRTAWQIAASLRRNATPLAVSAVTPASLEPEREAIVEVTGTGFESGTVVELLGPSDTPMPADSIVVSETQILITVPATTPSGSYDLRLTNAGGDALLRSGALTVGQQRLSLPLLQR